MDKSQKEPDNVKSLLSEFYQINEVDPDDNTSLTPSKMEAVSEQDSDIKKQNYLNSSQNQKNCYKSYKHEEQRPLSGGRQFGINYNQKFEENGGKAMQTCSTEAMESRRRNWEDQLREIKERRQSQQGGSFQQSQQFQKFDGSHKKIQSRFCNMDVNFNPSPWKNQQSSLQMSQVPSSRKKKPKKNKSHRKTVSSQLIVQLQYGQNGGKRKYQIGMRDFNKQWFRMLNNIHKK